MNCKRGAGIVLGLILSGTVLSAQEKATAGTAKLLTPEASLNIHAISDPRFSPDGTRLAFVVNDPPKDEGRLRHVWMYNKKTNGVRQFTYSAKSEFSPRWSPDGKQLAFLSNRGEQQQIYVMNAEMGEATAVTKGKRDVQNFAWSPDGKQMAYTAPDAPTEAEEKKEKDKDDARVVDKDEKHNRLWLLNLATGESRALTQPNWEVSELAWLPPGDGIVVSATDHPESDEATNRIFHMQVSDGAMKQLAAPRGPFSDLSVSPDGTSISYIGCREGGPDPHDLFLLATSGGDVWNLTGGNLDRAIVNYRWLKNGEMLAVAAEGFRNKFVGFTSAGVRKDAAAPLTLNPVDFDVSGSGEIVFRGYSGSRPQELWLWDQKSAAQQISHLNESWKEYSLSKPEYYKYKSFDCREIEAALLRPADYTGTGKLPLIVYIHGGPTGRWVDAVESWSQVFAAHGYAVFYPNIRGSEGYGEKFIESNRGDWGGGDFKDVMAGVKDLIDRGIADPDRLAIAGWSYGGYMAEWAITQTNIFKAAVSGAGMANLISEFGTEDHPSGDEWFYGAPYEPDKLAGFLNSSPFVHIKSAKTPTLILQGETDPVDPLGQSQELHRGLKHYGVETEFVVYPREPHGFKEEKHLLDRLKRMLAWFDKYLKPSP